MPIHFIDNYAPNSLESSIVKKDGTALYGEIWVYEQFLKFNEYDLLPKEKWYLKHNYNLSIHPSSKGKVEGQVDFLLLSRFGLLIIEVKGGGIRVDENDCFYSYNKSGEYEAENPFNQSKEYTHTLRELIDTRAFVYKAVIFPHEAGFLLKGPQLSGYDDLFFSKRKFQHLNADQSRAVTNLFFEFISTLAAKSRRKNISRLNPGWPLEKVNNKLLEKYPELKSKELKRLKSELFPSQSSYGYNPEKVNKEIILSENYEILKGLRRNQKTLIQGAPGTGKTVLATKFLAENLLKQHKGIMYCANKLVCAKLENIILNDYKLSSNDISFRIYSDKVTSESISSDLDFLVFDEAQEYFDKGLFDFIEELNKKLERPKILILYDPRQTIFSDFKDIAWYTDFFIENGFIHYLFDEIYRCAQSPIISEISRHVLLNKLLSKKEYAEFVNNVDSIEDKLRLVKKIVDESRFTKSEKTILIHSDLIEEFKKIVEDFFKKDFEELTEDNISLASSKIRFTTPLKYRGLENEMVYLITPELDSKSQVQNYVAITRAMQEVKLVLWI